MARPSAQPTKAAPSTTSGNGTANRVSATNAPTEIATSATWLSARFEIRWTACTTIAMTAGATPANSAVTRSVPPNRT